MSQGVAIRPLDEDVGQSNEIKFNQGALLQGRDLRNTKADYANSQERPIATKKAKGKQRSSSHVS